MARLVPAVRWLRGYRRAFLLGDLAGGLAVGSMLIAQGLAFAQIVQVPPVAGLWTGVAAMLAYALFGPSPRLIVGPEAGTAMMVAAVLTGAGFVSPAERLGAAALVALLVGAVLVGAGLFRLGAIADFFSRPILAGYINGVAVVLIVSQLPGVLGIPSTQGELLPQVVEIGARLGAVHGPSVWLSAGALGLLLVLRRTAPKLPGAVVVVTAGIIVSALLDLEARGVRVLGRIERAPPAIGLSELPVRSTLDLAPGALSIALLIFASSALTSRVFADRSRDAFRANAEFFGIAAANFAAGLVHGVPAAGSDARTAVNDAAGARTQAAGLFAAATVIAVVFLLAPVIALLPSALLGAIVIASALSLLDPGGVVRIWRVRAPEGLLALATFVGVLALGILPGVLVAVALAVADLVRRAAHPHDAVLGRLRGRPGYHDVEQRPGSETVPGLVVYRVDAPLFFANARFVRERVHALIDGAKAPVRMLVLDCGAMFDLDVTAAGMLEELDRELDARGITLALAEPHAPMRRVLRRTGLLRSIGDEHVFSTVGEAIRAYLARAATDRRRDVDRRRIDEPPRPSGGAP